jgi:hypothetical protein
MFVRVLTVILNNVQNDNYFLALQREWKALRKSTKQSDLFERK